MYEVNNLSLLPRAQQMCFVHMTHISWYIMFMWNIVKTWKRANYNMLHRHRQDICIIMIIVPIKYIFYLESVIHNVDAACVVHIINTGTSYIGTLVFIPRLANLSVTLTMLPIDKPPNSDPLILYMYHQAFKFSPYYVIVNYSNLCQVCYGYSCYVL